MYLALGWIRDLLQKGLQEEQEEDYQSRISGNIESEHSEESIVANDEATSYKIVNDDYSVYILSSITAQRSIPSIHPFFYSLFVINSNLNMLGTGLLILKIKTKY